MRRPRLRNIPIRSRSELGREMIRRTSKANPLDGLSVDNPDDMRLFHDRMDILVEEIYALKVY